MKARYFLSGLLTVVLAALLPAPAFSQVPNAQGAPKPLVAPFTEAEAKKSRGEWTKFCIESICGL